MDAKKKKHEKYERKKRNKTTNLTTPLLEENIFCCYAAPSNYRSFIRLFSSVFFNPHPLLFARVMSFFASTPKLLHCRQRHLLFCNLKIVFTWLPCPPFICIFLYKCWYVLHTRWSNWTTLKLASM